MGADKAYDVAQFIDALQDREVTPHIAVNGYVSKTGHRRWTAIDGRTTRHPGYAAYTDEVRRLGALSFVRMGVWGPGAA